MIGGTGVISRPSLTFGEGAVNFDMLRQDRNLVRRIREGKPGICEVYEKFRAELLSLVK